MTEDEARQVLLLQAVEMRAFDMPAAATPSTSAVAGRPAAWGSDDRSWATRQAVATVGSEATPERFVVARAVIALQRLLPRDPAAARWLARRGWHPAWVLLAGLVGAAAGLLADQLGVPQRVNLLAPAVWAVVAWNGAVYASLLWPWSAGGLRTGLARLGLRGPPGEPGASALWAEHAAPLMAHRAALVLHTAAAALGAGLVAGLYLRGLVLDYRAGWQSTFLDAPEVQHLLGWLLAPASALTGIAVPDVAPLRVGPSADAQASAAPWIHLYAATLAVAVLLPRSALALRAAWQSRRQAQAFPLPLGTPYFEALHPLMRPGQPRVLSLLWVGSAQPPGLFDLAPAPQPAGHPAPRTLLHSEQGDELQLLPVPDGLAAVTGLTAPTGPTGTMETTGTTAPANASWPPPAPPWWAPAWAPWHRGQPDPLPRLREQVAAVLLAAPPGAPRPPWLAALGRPVVLLVDGPLDPRAATEPETTLPLHQRADGWLAEGRLLRALGAVLGDDPRWRRLADTWTAQQAARFDTVVAELAHTLATVACARQPVSDDALLSRRADAETARALLLQGLDEAIKAHALRLSALPGVASSEETGLRPEAAAKLRGKVGEGRAALVGGMLSGALAGFKADLLSGGLTMGAGAVAGGLIGALSAAGAARGLNIVRGTDRSFVAWDEAALAFVTQALLARALVAAHGLEPDAAAERLAPALAVQQGSLAVLWRSRSPRFEGAGEAPALAEALRRPVADALVQALGGPRLPA